MHLRLALAAAGLAASLLVGEALAGNLAPPRSPARTGDAASPRGAARIPQAEFGSEFWSLAARFDSGHHLLIEFAMSNVGLGDGNAAVIGHWIDPSGAVTVFDSAKTADEWTLSKDRLHVDLGKVSLDQRGATHRLRVDKKRFKLDLAFEPGREDLHLEAFSGPAHGFDLLGLGSPASGRVWTETGGEQPLSGQIALTHRWSEGLESRFVRRRIELFTLDGSAEAYLLEALDPRGELVSWFVVRRDGEPLHAAPVQIRSEAPAEAGPPGFPLPETLHIRGEGIRGRVDLRAPLVRYDPLQDLPAVVRLALSPFLHWRTAGGPPPSALELTESPSGPLTLRGEGLTNVTYFHAMAEAPNVASPAAEPAP